MQASNSNHQVSTKLPSDLQWLDRLSGWMDTKFEVPGTNFRFGLDPILGLLPGVGDLTSFAISAYMLFHMVRYGTSGRLVILMLLNVALDTMLGSIPILGNVVDFFYKPNARNLRIFKEHYQEGKHRGSGLGILITLLVLFLLTIALMIYLVFWVLQTLFSLLSF